MWAKVPCNGLDAKGRDSKAQGAARRVALVYAVLWQMPPSAVLREENSFCRLQPLTVTGVTASLVTASTTNHEQDEIEFFLTLSDVAKLAETCRVSATFQQYLKGFGAYIPSIFLVWFEAQSYSKVKSSA